MKHEGMPRIILVPYPAQGHVTPLLQLASSFHVHGLQPLVVLPDFIYGRIVSKIGAASGGVVFVSLPSGLGPDEPKDFFNIGYAMEHHMPSHFEDVLLSHGNDGRVVCVVVDLLASWAIDVARRCGIPAAGFWPAMVATYHLIRAIPDLIRIGLISEHGTPLQKGLVRFLPRQPMLNPHELPWLVGNSASAKLRFAFWLRTLQRSRSMKWLLVNSFPKGAAVGDDEDDDDDISTLQHLPIFRIGPLIRPSKTSPTLWEEDRSCLEWLNEQPGSSVIYVSFGSWVKPIGDEKINQLALGLEATQRPFLWVLAPVWRAGLPTGYLDRVKDRCMVAYWVPQKEVLAHEAVGCYLTHCGWNSTMEAIQAQKRLLCYPVSGDQFVNCRYIVKVWGIGEEIGGGTQHDVEEGVRRLMEGGGDMQRRVEELKERVMGEEASNGATSRLIAFLDVLHNRKVFV
ncbi:UDP-glycosyltransferase 82A1-like [Aristolochia californica]|uniref:UDP-glycosyltransferase 82A1-like n=1 Tax=Aristolochia californica TaxID=171875 RepID=UPI0035DB9F6D